MKLKRIETDAELRRLHSVGDGFIYNDFSGTGPSGQKYNILHVAFCHWVTKSKADIPKYFFNTIDEAIDWLHKNRGNNWKRCRTCLAKDSPRKTRQKPVAPTQIEIFTEGEVEQLLIQYLKHVGYRIHRQVRVPSGIIDIIAEKDRKKLLIEAKGEDKGGYTSAEMNFQLGLGQLMSRMIHQKAEYGLAFPLTKDFMKVLRKYKDSFAFEKLGISLIPVKRDGSCRLISPNNAVKFFDEIVVPPSNKT